VGAAGSPGDAVSLLFAAVWLLIVVSLLRSGVFEEFAWAFVCHLGDCLAALPLGQWC
jgi:hypothetical protein